MSELLGGSPGVVRLRERIARVAPLNCRVLILGENGAGKELVAQDLHAGSPRAGNPFVALNCAAVPETLLEAELFGHEKGAFTGAHERRIGRFEAAHTGTLFLDEIGEMPISMQARLLRVLQLSAFERVGGRHTVRVDVRVIAATNKDLRAEVMSRRFREDLYHRLAVFPLYVPPLRERTEDIPILLRAFLVALHDSPPDVTDGALGLLRAHPWRGNVRELKNVAERLLVLAEGPVTEDTVHEALGLDSVMSSARSPVAAAPVLESPAHVPHAPLHPTPAPPAPLALTPGARVRHSAGAIGEIEFIQGSTVHVLIVRDEHGHPMLPLKRETWTVQDIGVEHVQHKSTD